MRHGYIESNHPSGHRARLEVVLRIGKYMLRPEVRLYRHHRYQLQCLWSKQHLWLCAYLQEFRNQLSDLHHLHLHAKRLRRNKWNYRQCWSVRSSSQSFWIRIGL